MGKKIKFPLEMKDGIKVRSLEEFKENFNLEKAINYFIDGRLKTWLNDRYYENEAKELVDLDINSIDFKTNICKIFEVDFVEEDLDLKEIEQRNQRIIKLKQFSENEEAINNIDSVAFDQEELADLLDADFSTIYLSGKIFNIPLSKENIRYIGLNECIVNVDSKEIVDFESKKIYFENVKFDDEYNNIVQENKRVSQEIKYKTSEIGYCLINKSDFKECENIFNVIQEELQGVEFDINSYGKGIYALIQEELRGVKFDINSYGKDIYDVLKNANLQGLFDSF